MIRTILGLLAMLALVACTPQNLDQPTLDLGDFKLGHNVVVATKMQKGPISRDATEEEWTSALTNAFAQRLGRYEGEKLYHIGVSVEGFMLAPKGVPVVYTPKSALLLNVTVWDDAKGRKMNAQPHQIAVLEDTDENSILIGSGWGRTREEQIQGLSYNAAYLLEKWLAENKETLDWFTGGVAKQPPKQERPQVEGL